jgi:hypothetical protein
MAAKMGGISVLAIAAILLFSFAPFFSFAAGTTVTVQTSQTSYPNATTGSQIPINGTVSPAPGVAGYSVTIEVTNPSGLYFVASAPVNGTTGTFGYTLVTGSPSNLWGNGTYTVTAVYAVSTTSPTYTGSTTFTYGEFASTTSSSSSSGSSSGVATTIITSVVTTIVQNEQTTTVVTSATTVNLGTTIVSATTTTVQAAATTLGETLGAVGIVIAIIAGGIAAMALRKH